MNIVSKLKPFFFKYSGRENCTKNFKPFYKQIKKIGVEGPTHFLKKIAYIS